MTEPKQTSDYNLHAEWIDEPPAETAAFWAAVNRALAFLPPATPPAAKTYNPDEPREHGEWTSGGDDSSDEESSQARIK